MDSESAFMLVAVILVVVLGGGYLYFLMSSSGYEGISNNALDLTCKTLMDNETATYYKESGFQEHFPCKVGNEIKVFGVEDE